MSYVSTSAMVADAFTKPLPRDNLHSAVPHWVWSNPQTVVAFMTQGILPHQGATDNRNPVMHHCMPLFYLASPCRMRSLGREAGALGGAAMASFGGEAGRGREAGGRAKRPRA